MASVPGFALDLMGSYEKALQVDPDMLAADEAVLAGREKAVQGRALLKPQVALSASLVARQRPVVDEPAAGAGRASSSRRARATCTRWRCS